MRFSNLYVPGPFIRLVRDFFFHAGQLLLQVENFILMELCEIIQLLL